MVKTATPALNAWVSGTPASTVRVTLPVTARPWGAETDTVTTPFWPYTMVGALIVIEVLANVARFDHAEDIG